MEGLGAAPSWSAPVSSDDVSRRRVILWNREAAPELAASVGILWRLVVAPGVLGDGGGGRWRLGHDLTSDCTF